MTLAHPVGLHINLSYKWTSRSAHQFDKKIRVAPLNRSWIFMQKSRTLMSWCILKPSKVHVGSFSACECLFLLFGKGGTFYCNQRPLILSLQVSLVLNLSLSILSSTQRLLLVNCYKRGGSFETWKWSSTKVLNRVVGSCVFSSWVLVILYQQLQHRHQLELDQGFSFEGSGSK